MTIAAKFVLAIVDDDYRVLESMGDLLESAGHAVRLFGSPQCFMESDALREIDCLIADIRMPVMDGFELRRRARVVRPGLPVIFITAGRGGAEERLAATDRHHGFFRKPFDSTVLLAAVTEAVQEAAAGR